MSEAVFVYDPTASDELSKVRGIGRYLQILRENFPGWQFESELRSMNHESGTFINPFINFLQRPVLTKRIAERQIAVIHDLIPLKYPEHFPAGIKGGINIFANKLALKNYDIIVTDSEASKKDIVKILGINEAKIKVIYPVLPNFFENSNIENSPEIRTLKIENYCIYVGDVTWNKNVVNMAKAIKIANLPCIFVGKAFSRASSENKWDEEFKQFQELVQGDKNFIFPGFVSDSELKSLYQNAKTNLLLSRDEGFGFSFLEAASVGCPSIVADIPVLQEISAKSALYANPEDPHDIALKINTLYKDEKIWLQWSKDAKKRSEFFSSEKFTKEFLKLIS